VADAPAPASADLVGVVTVLFGGDDVVEGFFESLAGQDDVPMRVYVIDNNPTPALTERCRDLAAHHGIDAVCVFNDENVGVARGNNIGIDLALGDGCRWVLLANNDTEFAPGTFSALLAPMRAGELVTTPKILFPGSDRRIWYAGGRLGAWTSCTPHIGFDEPDRGQFDAEDHTGYAPTCFMLIDASVFSRVGTMDERYFAYYDDTDFVWRMRRAGLRIRYVPGSVVIHKVGSSTGGVESPFTLFHGNRNRVYFIRKNYRGLRRVSALGYVLATRVAKSFRQPRAASARMWAGVREGFRVPTRSDVA